MASALGHRHLGLITKVCTSQGSCAHSWARQGGRKPPECPPGEDPSHAVTEPQDSVLGSGYSYIGPSKGEPVVGQGQSGFEGV